MQIKFDENENISIEIDLSEEHQDQCVNCDNIEDCPLVNALQEEVVVPVSASIEVNNCGLYCSNMQEETINVESFWDRLRIALRVLFTGEY